MSIAGMIACDLLFIAVGLNVFALFHHVLNFQPEVTPVALATPAPLSTPSPTPAPQPDGETPEESAAPVKEYCGVWGEKFSEHFTDGEIISTETSYRSEHIAIEYTHVERDGVIYSVADIYLSDLKYLRAGFAAGEFSHGIEYLSDMAARENAIVAISGDHCAARYEGIVVRNGLLYRETRFQDVGILLNDGRLVTLSDAQLDLNELKETGAWQVWSFGPLLLENGQAAGSFRSDVTGNNPRSAIGYVEPGHYVFIQVDGRIEASRGLTMTELAELFVSYGCETAYNLDGGQSAGMVWQGELVSYPYGRQVSDCIVIVDMED